MTDPAAGAKPGGGQGGGNESTRHRRGRGHTGRFYRDGDSNAQGDANASRYLRAPAKPSPRASYDPARATRHGVAEGAADERVQMRPAGDSWHQSRLPRNRSGGRAVFAALDLGTNNCRLLVALPTEHGRFRVVDAFSRIVRLGEGMASSGSLSQEAMDRAIEALAVCANKLGAHQIAGQRLIATEACRSADNGAAFLERVVRETGLTLEVVDRETEARLAAEGCGALMDRHADAAVLFDIGGGSSELILVNRRRASGRRISQQIAAWTSMPIGVVTLSERHGGRHVSREGFDAMVDDVMQHLRTFEGRSALADVWHPARTHLLGTSGTVTTIAGVHLGLTRYDRRKVDGIWLSDGQVDAVMEALIAMDYDARAANPCIGRERADLVLAGCAILQAIRQTWPSPRLRVADRGLREGILSELMHDAGAWRGQSRRSPASVEQGA